MHSEFNHEDEETNIFQIWIIPKSRDIEPKWGSAEFPTTSTTDKLKLLVLEIMMHRFKFIKIRIYTGMFK